MNYEHYRKYGEIHGTAMLFDASKPDVDAWLDYMEGLYTPNQYEAYLDGFMSGKLGECVEDHPSMMSFARVGSDEDGIEEEESEDDA